MERDDLLNPQSPLDYYRPAPEPCRFGRFSPLFHAVFQSVIAFRKWPDPSQALKAPDKLILAGKFEQ